MSSIRSDIRILIAKYGLPAVHTELQAEMREMFNFLRPFYDAPKNNLVIPVSQTIPDRIATPHHKPITVTLNTLEPPALELSSEENDSLPVPTQEHAEEQEPSTLKEVVIQARKEMNQESSEKFSKARHREEVVKKNKELIEKGIRPESLLTKDNLAKWLAEGMSYMRIAREQVGVHENEVAVMAKNFGLQSDIKKYIVMKKGAAK
jgi:hypothetical protein